MNALATQAPSHTLVLVDDLITISTNQFSFLPFTASGLTIPFNMGMIVVYVHDLSEFMVIYMFCFDRRG